MTRVDQKYILFWRRRFEAKKAESRALSSRARGDLEAAISILKNYGAKRVLLFGSLCKSGHFRPGSDIDLAVEGIPPDKITRAAADLMMTLEWPTDLKPIEEMDAFFRLRILESGELLYAESTNNSPPYRRDKG